MITSSITETKTRLSEFINLCEVENEIIIITKHGKPVSALVPIANHETLTVASEQAMVLKGVDEPFARQIDEFIRQYHPALRALSRN